jgi:hypothetical protein
VVVLRVGGNRKRSEEVVFVCSPLIVILVRHNLGGGAGGDWCLLVASWWCFGLCRVSFGWRLGGEEGWTTALFKYVRQAGVESGESLH